MATVNDFLVTTLKLVGGQQYAAQFNALAAAASHTSASQVAAATTGNKLAKAFGVTAAAGGAAAKASAAAGGAAAALAAVAGPAGAAAAALAGIAPAAGVPGAAGGVGALNASTLVLFGQIGALLGLLGSAVHAFAETEQQTFRTTIALKNLGSSLSIDQVTAFANQMRQSTTASNADIIGTVGVLKRFGASDKEVMNVTKSIMDFSAGAGIPLEHATRAVGHALIGNARMLRNLGVEMKLTGDRGKDLIIVQKKLEDLFGGAAEARRNTLAGAFDALKNSIIALLSALGSQLATVLIPILHVATALVDQLTTHMYVFTALIGAAIGARIGGAYGALIGLVAGGLLGAFVPAAPNAAANIGTGKERLATEETLERIASNTDPLTSIISRVFGGSGEVFRRSFTVRDQRMAVGI